MAIEVGDVAVSGVSRCYYSSVNATRLWKGRAAATRPDLQAWGVCNTDVSSHLRAPTILPSENDTDPFWTHCGDEESSGPTVRMQTPI